MRGRAVEAKRTKRSRGQRDKDVCPKGQRHEPAGMGCQETEQERKRVVGAVRGGWLGRCEVKEGPSSHPRPTEGHFSTDTTSMNRNGNARETSHLH